VYNARRPCTSPNDCNANELCYYPVADPTQGGRCWCAPGGHPNAGDQCYLTPTSSAWGTVLRGQEWRNFDVAYTLQDRRLQWFNDPTGTILYAVRVCGIVHLLLKPFHIQPVRWGRLTADLLGVCLKWPVLTFGGACEMGQAYVSEPIDVIRHASYRISPAHLFVFACTNPSQFFVNTTAVPSVDAIPHCQGISNVCNGYGDSILSNPLQGTCVCRFPRNGTFCDSCFDGTVPPSCTQTPLACRTAVCNGHGYCLSDTSCACDLAYVGGATSRCTYNSTQCRIDRCSGHGSCLDMATLECQCDVGWFGVNCGMNWTTCRTQRCSDRSNCTGSLQGCQASIRFLSRFVAPQLGTCPKNPLQIPVGDGPDFNNTLPVPSPTPSPSSTGTGTGTASATGTASFSPSPSATGTGTGTGTADVYHPPSSLSISTGALAGAVAGGVAFVGAIVWFCIL
jgi:hypothetical protein